LEFLRFFWNYTKRILKDQRGVFLPPQALTETDSGNLLLKSLQREPTGISPQILDELSRILRETTERERLTARGDVARLGGATGTTGSPLLQDILTRRGGELALGEASQLTQNKLQDILLRSQQAGQIGQLRLGGAGLEAQMGQARSTAERGLFGQQEALRLQNRAALPSGLERTGRLLTSAGGLGDLFGGISDLGSLLTSKNPASNSSAFLDRLTGKQENLRRSALPRNELRLT